MSTNIETEVSVLVNKYLYGHKKERKEDNKVDTDENFAINAKFLLK